MNVFWSYARLDDKEPLRKVTQLRNAFEITLSQVLGEECEVYFDRFTLRWGVRWRENIKFLVEGADKFIAVVTPSYFNSRMCIFEFKLAIEAEKEIYPIYFRDCRKLRSIFKENGVDAETNKELNKISQEISNFQWLDFCDLRSKDTNHPKTQDFLDRMAEEIIE
jgi:hypothetical protein